MRVGPPSPLRKRRKPTSFLPGPFQLLLHGRGGSLPVELAGHLGAQVVGLPLQGVALGGVGERLVRELDLGGGQLGADFRELGTQVGKLLRRVGIVRLFTMAMIRGDPSVVRAWPGAWPQFAISRRSA